VRSRLAVLVVALAAAAAGTTSAAGSTPLCRAAQLRGHLLGSSGAAGTILLSVTLTNQGATCTLTGYTRLQLMAGARRPLATHVVHGGLAILSQRPGTVVLRHGGAATVLIAYGDVPTGYERRRPTGTEILFRVPADQTWIGVPARTTACSHGTLRESPVLAGRRRAP
jgi:Domain of unknown function (DUF4232)